MDENKDYSVAGTESADSEAPRIVDLGDGRELYEHFRFVADKGQELLRVDKFLEVEPQPHSAGRTGRMHSRERPTCKKQLPRKAARHSARSDGPSALRL